MVVVFVSFSVLLKDPLGFVSLQLYMGSMSLGDHLEWLPRPSNDFFDNYLAVAWKHMAFFWGGGSSLSRFKRWSLYSTPNWALNGELPKNSEKTPLGIRLKPTPEWVGRRAAGPSHSAFGFSRISGSVRLSALLCYILLCYILLFLYPSHVVAYRRMESRWGLPMYAIFFFSPCLDGQ